MDTPKLRSILSLKEGGLLRQEYLAIPLTYGAEVSVKDLLLTLIEDYQNGYFAGYSNPRLITRFSETLMKDYEKLPLLGDISSKNNPDEFIRRLNVLYGVVKTGACVPNQFRLGDNWETKGNFDVISFLHKPRPSEQPSQLMLTARTRTEHLTPFIDGKVEDGILIVHDAKGEIRESIVYHS